MKKVILFLMLFVATLTFVGCGNDKAMMKNETEQIDSTKSCADSCSVDTNTNCDSVTKPKQ